MRLFFTILLAGAISFFVGFGVTYATSALIACRSDAAGCGLGDAYRLLLVPVYVMVAMIAFGIAAAGKPRERPLLLTMLTLVLVAVFLVMFAVASDMQSGRATQIADVLEAFQLAITYWTVVVVQWLLIRAYVRKRDAAGGAPA